GRLRSVQLLQRREGSRKQSLCIGCISQFLVYSSELTLKASTEKRNGSKLSTTGYPFRICEIRPRLGRLPGRHCGARGLELDYRKIRRTGGVAGMVEEALEPRQSFGRLATFGQPLCLLQDLCRRTLGPAPLAAAEQQSENGNRR